MASDHERTKNKILIDYSDSKTYVLYDNKQAFGETASGFKAQFGLGAGTSDIIGYCVKTGLFVAIEVKTPKYKTLSDKQRSFLEHVHDSGAISLIATQEFTETGYSLCKYIDYKH